MATHFHNKPVTEYKSGKLTIYSAFVIMVAKGGCDMATAVAPAVLHSRYLLLSVLGFFERGMSALVNLAEVFKCVDAHDYFRLQDEFHLYSCGRDVPRLAHPFFADMQALQSEGCVCFLEGGLARISKKGKDLLEGLTFPEYAWTLQCAASIDSGQASVLLPEVLSPMGLTLSQLKGLPKIWVQERNNPIIRIKFDSPSIPMVWCVVEGEEWGNNFRFYGYQVSTSGLPIKGNFLLSDVWMRGGCSDPNFQAGRSWFETRRGLHNIVA